MYGSGVKEVNIIYRFGKTNTNADALSCDPCSPALQEGIAECEVQVAVVSGGSTTSIDTLLQTSPMDKAPTILARSKGKMLMLMNSTVF